MSRPGITPPDHRPRRPEAPRIAIVVSPRDWASRLHRDLRDHGGATVVARVMEPREALAQDYAVLIAEDATSYLTPRFVEQVHRLGRRVLGVHPAADAWAANHLREVGCDDLVPMDAPTEEFLAAITALNDALRLDADLARLTSGEAWDDEPVGEPTLDLGGVIPATDGVDRDTPRDQNPPAPRGRVTVVGGPRGAGRTEVAIEIAAAIRRRGESVVLVDADDTAPAVAQRLGLDPQPNLRTAVDVAQQRPDSLYRAVQSLATGFEVVTGLPRPEQWDELRPGEVADLVEDLRGVRQHVVIDIGPELEDLGGLAGRGRHDLARTLVAAADLIVAVGDATPVGISRLARWVAAATDLTRAPVALVANRVPRARFTSGELADELARISPGADVHMVGADEGVRRAAWDGELAPKGRFVKAIARLVDALPDAAQPGGPGGSDARPAADDRPSLVTLPATPMTEGAA